MRPRPTLTKLLAASLILFVSSSAYTTDSLVFWRKGDLPVDEERLLTSALGQAGNQIEALDIWMGATGPVKQSIEACDSENSGAVFRPLVTAPDAASEGFKTLCDRVPPSREYLENYAGRASCEFTTFTPCVVVLKRRYQAYFSAKVPPANVRIPDLSGQIGSVLVDHIVGFVAEHDAQIEQIGVETIVCRAIAILGIQPQWVCGSGQDYAWRAKAPETDATLILYPNIIRSDNRIIPFSGPDESEIEAIRDPNYLKGFIEEVLRGQL
jgi:hypothetical protein